MKRLDVSMCPKLLFKPLSPLKRLSNLVQLYRIAGKFRELDEVEQFADKTPGFPKLPHACARTYKKFADKTFAVAHSSLWIMQ